MPMYLLQAPLILTSIDFLKSLNISTVFVALFIDVFSKTNKVSKFAIDKYKFSI